MSSTYQIVDSSAPLDEYIQKIEEASTPREIYEIDVENLRTIGLLIPALATKIAMHLWRILENGLWIEEISGVKARDFMHWIELEILPYYQPSDRPYIKDIARIVMRVFPILEENVILNPKTNTRLLPSNIMYGNVKKLKAGSFHIANAPTLEKKIEIIQAAATMGFSKFSKEVLLQLTIKVRIPYKVIQNKNGTISIEMPELNYEQFALLIELLGEAGEPIAE